METKIIAINTDNDLEGRQMVFAQLVRGWISNNYNVEVFSSKDTNKIIKDFPNTKIHTLSKHCFNRKGKLNLLYFLLVQIGLFFKMFKYRNENADVYIQSNLSPGALIAARILKKRVVSHVFDHDLTRNYFNQWMNRLVTRLSDEVIFLSDYTFPGNRFASSRKNYLVNYLDSEVVAEALRRRSPQYSEVVRVLADQFDLSRDPGIFIRLASSMPVVKFELLVNVSRDELHNFLSMNDLPSNLFLYSAQSYLHPFFKQWKTKVDIKLPKNWQHDYAHEGVEALILALPLIGHQYDVLNEVIESEYGMLDSDIQIGDRVDALPGKHFGNKSTIFSYPAKVHGKILRTMTHEQISDLFFEVGVN